MLCIFFREDFLCFWQGDRLGKKSPQFMIQRWALVLWKADVFQFTIYLEYSLSGSQMKIWPLLGSPSTELKLQFLSPYSLRSAKSSSQFLSA